MKKSFYLCLFLALSVSAFAQKSYVTVFCELHQSGHSAILSGDIPESMKPNYYGSDFGKDVYTYAEYWIGNLLNLLASYGFSVEQKEMANNNILYLLSKPSDGSNPSTSIQVVKADDESKIYEVARYNLQGLPINKNEKGIQIVVYSNYTTKTIIKE